MCLGCHSSVIVAAGICINMGLTLSFCTETPIVCTYCVFRVLLCAVSGFESAGLVVLCFLWQQPACVKLVVARE